MHLSVVIKSDSDDSYKQLKLPVNNEVFDAMRDEKQWRWNEDKQDAYKTKLGSSNNIVWLSEHLNLCDGVRDMTSLNIM
jgi:hypothetical protein